jgi:hypothetical protein
VTDHPTLFELPPPLPDPTKIETHCPLCHRQLIFDKHGQARHRPGDGRKCEEEMRARWAAEKAGGAA